MRKLLIILSLSFISCIFFGFSINVLGQLAGSIDLTFGRPVSLLGDSSRFNASQVHTVLIQPDQKIIVAGSFTSYNGVQRNRIVRLNPDGNYDSLAFFVASGFSTGTVYSLALQSNSKIIAAGDFATYNAQPRSGLVRINSDGSLDMSFNVGSGLTGGSRINAIAIQSDGKIIAGGNFTLFNGIPVNGLVRLNMDGSVDTTFNIGSGFNGEVHCITIDSVSNKIFIGGDFSTYKGISHSRLVCLDLNGGVDASFNIGIGFNNRVRKILLYGNTKVIVVGEFTSVNSIASNRIIQLDYTGTHDNSFVIGTGFSGIVKDVIFDNSGNLIVAGDFNSYNGITQDRMTRLTQTGTINTPFPLQNVNPTGFGPKSIALQSNGNVVAVGKTGDYNNTWRNGVFRLDTNFLLDNTFNVSFGIDGNTYNSYAWVNAIAVQPDNKILVGGDFYRFNGYLSYALVRLDEFGEIDTTFHHPFGNASDPVNTIIVDSINSKIYVGGRTFITNQGTLRGLIRLNWNGSLDTTFNIGVGFSGTVRTILLQHDGKLIVAGTFTAFDGANCNSIVRLENYGTRDLSFSLGTGFTGSGSVSVNKILLQPDGKIIAGGFFDVYNGNSAGGIVRINPNGSYDNTFITGNGFGTIIYGLHDMILQSDGKIVAGGSFISYDTTNANNIARLDSTGTIDLTFYALQNLGTSRINTLAMQSTGKIIVGGSFIQWGSNIANSIARLNSDGTYDNSFISGSGYDFPTYALAIQDDDKILVGGDYRNYNGFKINRLSRLEGTFSTSIIQQENPKKFYIYPNPCNGLLNIFTESNYYKNILIELYTTFGERVFQQALTGPTAHIPLNLSSGIYIVKVTQDKEYYFQKVVLSR